MSETVEPNPHTYPEPEHIGDGVYVSFDGSQIWLAVNHHDNLVVALEPEVFRRLLAYVARLRKIHLGEF